MAAVLGQPGRAPPLARGTGQRLPPASRQSPRGARAPPADARAIPVGRPRDGQEAPGPDGVRRADDRPRRGGGRRGRRGGRASRTGWASRTGRPSRGWPRRRRGRDDDEPDAHDAGGRLRGPRHGDEAFHRPGRLGRRRPAARLRLLPLGQAPQDEAGAPRPGGDAPLRADVRPDRRRQPGRAGVVRGGDPGGATTQRRLPRRRGRALALHRRPSLRPRCGCGGGRHARDGRQRRRSDAQHELDDVGRGGGRGRCQHQAAPSALHAP